MNQEKSKMLYVMGGIIISLIAIIYGILVNSVNETQAELKTHETTQNTATLDDVKWKSSIDSRLSNIERALKIQSKEVSDKSLIN